MKKQHILIALSVILLVLLTACGHEHSYGKWKTEKEATCEKEGRKVRVCDCGEEETEKIPKLDHEFGEWTDKTASTCSKEGSRERTCAECGEIEKEKLPKAEHTYKYTSGTATSCQPGSAVDYVCEVCGEARTETATAKTYAATELYDLYLNSVGEITTYEKNGQGRSLGSCFVQTADGKLITNYHVIEGAYSAKVSLGGQTYDVQKVLAYDKNIDAAVLQINASNLKPMTICELEHKVGETVYAFGSSKGLTATFSDGMITHAKREDDGVTYVQHSAPISQGNSGGPLINTYGEVIGINTLYLLDSQNLNFAVCIAELKNLDYSKPVTMQQLYDAENNPYKKLVNYVVTAGDLSDGDYFLTLKEGYTNTFRANCELAAAYFPESGELWLYLCVGGKEYTYVVLDEELSGVYEWGYFDDYDFEMDGTLYANTFDSNTLLGYSYNNISNTSRRTQIRESASDMMTMIGNNLTSGLSDIGVTAQDLGFVKFS